MIQLWGGGAEHIFSDYTERIVCSDMCTQESSQRLKEGDGRMDRGGEEETVPRMIRRE